ncbi:MAG: aconitate hydratase AcnA [Planctomycetaceae bacterium]|jgi:aconitate hydratase|nr:aconitate hydratase AcnA [Planctomycetaceae bacterium]
MSIQNCQRQLVVHGKTYSYFSLNELGSVSHLPFSVRVLLESLLRNRDGVSVTDDDVTRLLGWGADKKGAGDNEDGDVEVPFKPSRVILQDFTGVPAVVDLAAMRAAMKFLGGNPTKINPLIPVDLVIDHSVQTDFYGTADAQNKNAVLEFQRNSERYALLRWAQQSLDNFRVVPPSVGIIHQVNLEFLSPVVMQQANADTAVAAVIYPDSVVGTDSHTVMINGLGVLGWGVGGIEAEAVMLGQPYYMLAPEVIGVELVGRLRNGVTATDLVLTMTEILRREGVVGKFVEFFGSGARTMPVADRAVLANMAPEYGATMGFFPVDEQTISFLRQTGRSDEQVAIVEAYCKANALFSTDGEQTPRYTKILSFDLANVEPTLAGPKRPQDRVPLKDMKPAFAKSLSAPVKERGFAVTAANNTNAATITYDDGTTETLRHGSVVIASITSCTNTSNPNLIIAAGLLAQKAAALGLKPPRYVKTSFGPGSRVVVDYLTKAGLLTPLETLGFNVVGYGCLTCIGNSGNLPKPVVDAVSDLVVAAVLSGNRNFEGRVNPLVKANYLASPPLVVAFALAGRVDIDVENEPLGVSKNGQQVFLRDIFPTDAEVAAAVSKNIEPQMYAERYRGVFGINKDWNAIPAKPSGLFKFDESSTYIQEPPFLLNMRFTPPPAEPIEYARCLAAFGDSVTTDHISPAGSIKADSPAGQFLVAAGVSPTDFNSYGSRRGNDRVMTRGTFANIRIRNQLLPESEGGVTRYFPTGETMPIYDAAMRYRDDKTPLVILAGAEYGTGSSRDWAAKGTALLGVKAVIASSFERIHRGNLVGMGILPLELPEGVTWQSLGLTGDETFFIEEIDENFKPRSGITVRAQKPVDDDHYTELNFAVKVRIDTPVELLYYLNGGIMQTVIRKLVS